jgi:hypothetical protein
MAMKFDYSILDPQERIKYIENLLPEKTHWSSRELLKMADYIIAANEPRENHILTDNRMVTINRRETSYQGLSDALEGGEDALHTLIRQDKQTILTPKNRITEADIQQIPELRKLRERIIQWEIQLETAKGRERYRIKKILIEMRKEQYTIKQMYRAPMYSKNTYQIKVKTSTVDELRLDEPEHVSAILENYVRLKQTLWDDLHNDLRWTLIDLENIIEEYIRYQQPIYYEILLLKVGGSTNEEIQNYLAEQWGKQHSQEYISSLWRNKIPEFIADGYREHHLNWVYTFKLRGLYKTCSRCLQPKLAHRRYFGTNQAAKYGFYSVCKKCRNKK